MCLPTALRLPTEGSGDFGTSSLYGQLSGKPKPVRYHVGVPDAKWGEAIKAVVELKPGEPALAEDLIAICRERLGPVKTPKSVDFVATLPRSAVGKVMRRAVRDTYWVGETRRV